MPDIHKLDPYQLGFINKMLKISEKLEYEYLDLLPVLKVSQKKNLEYYGDPSGT